MAQRNVNRNIVIASPPKLSFRRPITSYAKIQNCIGNLIRNRTFQLCKPRIKGLQYLDVGCGRNVHPEFINMDYLWHPKLDLCWDIRRGLPFQNGSMLGIFSEHCLEHFSVVVAFNIIRECRRLLAPGGVFRIVVPDAELYLDIYHRQMAGDSSITFPFQDNEAFDGIFTPILSVNRVFYQDRDSLAGHRYMYDFSLLQALLSHAGFNSIKRVAYREGSDATLLIDSEIRASESLYVEATR
jgi:predicted SAM-dependent methyltransferase